MSPGATLADELLRSAREQAERAREELALWLELSPLPMLLFDETGQLLRWNAPFAALCPPRPPASLQLAPPALQQLLGWDGPRPANELLACQNGVTLLTRADLTDATGRRRWMHGRLRPLPAAAPGTPRGFMAVIEDLSAEQERELAHQQLDALMDTAGVGLATFQQDAGWLRPRGPASAGSPSAPGKPHALDGLQGVGRDLVEPASMPEFERLQRALKNGDRVEVRYAVRHPELGRRWLLTRVEPGRLASGQRTTSVVTLDVTAQTTAEKRSELLLHELTTIMDGAGLGLAYLRFGNLVRCNAAFAAMLGLDAAALPGGTPLAALFARLPALGAQVARALPGLGAGGKPFEAEFQPAGEDGTVQGDKDGGDEARADGRWFSLTLRRVGGEAQAEAETVAVISDISRLKSQQAELEALVRDRELMFSLSDVGIAILRHGRIARANDALAELTGYRIHELDGLPQHALFDSIDDYERLQGPVRAALAASGQWQGERRVRRRDGSGIWMQVSQRVMNSAGPPDEGQIATFVNVDDRWRAQQSLMLQTERERAVLDSVMVGIVTVGRGGIEWMNRSARRMFGGGLGEFLGQDMALVATADPQHPFRQTHYLTGLAEGEVETFECRLKARDGREFWVVGNAVVTGTEPGNRQLTYALLDIERRRQAEAQSLQAQASLRRIIEAAPLAISLHDGDTLAVAQANPAGTLFGETAGPQLREDMAAALLAPGSEVVQHEYRIGDGAQARVWDARLLRLAGLPDEGAPPDQLLLVASDVTEHRAAEEARLEAAISQRELLVREVHHRIKNNLQGVAGLLQQIAARRPEVAGVISEAVGQVNAIAQVYGLQVGSQGPLRVRRVMEAIVGSVQRMSGRRILTQIGGETAGQSQQWTLPEPEAIPIALTLNELLTNAIKHSGDSEVRCTLVCKPASVAVEIENPGRLPAGFDINALAGGVSGLGLVRALLPRRSALLDLAQQGDTVLCRVELWPPSVALSLGEQSAP